MRRNRLPLAACLFAVAFTAPLAAALPKGSPQAMLEAVRAGDADKVRDLLRADPLLANAYDPAGVRGKPSFDDHFTALQLAVWGGHRKIVELLLDHKADVNLDFHGTSTPLHLAAELGNKEIVRLLLARKADVNRGGAWAPLHAAALRGHTEVAELLLAKGAKLDLHTASALGKRDEVAALLKKSPTLVDARSGPNWKASPLLWAAMHGRAEVAELLLAQKANVNARSSFWGSTALHEAAGRGHIAVVRVLLAHKATVDAKDGSGRTPLHLAAEEGREATVRLLLEAKADANAREDAVLPFPSSGPDRMPPLTTPLHLAARGGHAGVVKLLLAFEADPGAKDGEGRTPFRVTDAKKFPEVAKLLGPKE